MTVIRRGRVTGAIAIAAGLAASHELTYLLAHGTGSDYQRAMQDGGHGSYWSSFALTATGLAVALGVALARELLRLTRQARAIGRGGAPVDPESPRHLVRHVVGTWVPQASITIVLFVVQENVERLGSGPAPGLAAISGDHAVAAPVIAAVTLAISVVLGLMRWRRDVLIARLAVHRRSPAPHRLLRPVSQELARQRATERWHGVRAPPLTGPLVP